MHNLQGIVKSLNLLLEAPLVTRPTKSEINLEYLLERYFVKVNTTSNIEIHLFKNYFVAETQCCSYIYKYTEENNWVALSHHELMKDILDTAIREGLDTTKQGSFEAYDLADVFTFGLLLQDFKGGYFIDNYQHIVKLVRACPFGLRGKLAKTEVIREYLEVIDLDHFI